MVSNGSSLGNMLRVGRQNQAGIVAVLLKSRQFEADKGNNNDCFSRVLYAVGTGFASHAAIQVGFGTHNIGVSGAKRYVAQAQRIVDAAVLKGKVPEGLVVYK